MKNTVLEWLMRALLKMLKPELLIEAWESLVEKLQLAVADSSNPYDDLILGAIMDLDPAIQRDAVDAILDVIEDGVASSGTQVDDIIVLPLVALIRST